MAIIGGAFMGAVNGIIPLLIAIHRKMTFIGILGFMTCIPFGIIAVAFINAMLLTPIFACTLALVIFLVFKKA